MKLIIGFYGKIRYNFKSYIEEMEQFLIKKHIENQYENDMYQDEDEDRHFMQSIAV